MTNHLVLFFLALLLTSPQEKSRLVPFEDDDGKWGYKNAAGEVVLQPRYAVAQPFLASGIAAAVDDTGWVYIDARGKAIIRPHVVDNGPDEFSEGLARFVVKEKFGFFDETGRIVIKPRFDFVLPFHEGLAAVCIGCRPKQEGEHTAMVGGKWGFINKKGKLVIEPTFDAAESFEGDKARVKTKDRWKYIGK
jgi:hypothetical protein